MKCALKPLSCFCSLAKTQTILRFLYCSPPHFRWLAL